MVEAKGNTKPSPIKCKRISASKNWCFVHNNFTEKNLEEMVEIFTKLTMKYVIGKEVGESGTPHLQGAVFSEISFRPMEKCKLTFKPHWEKCKGNMQQNITYCIKDGDYVTNIELPEPLFIPEMYGWQLKLHEILASPPTNSDRTIHWFWSKEGNRGKSDAVRWLVLKHNAVVCAGKTNDMKCLVVKFTEKNNNIPPKLVVMDVPRSVDKISYGGLEEVKNGIFASPKYESCMHKQNRPHMIIFANFFPEGDKDMSADRYRIYNVDQEADEGHVIDYQFKDDMQFGKAAWEF